jgi:hypothetical protein
MIMGYLGVANPKVAALTELGKLHTPEGASSKPGFYRHAPLAV